MSGAGFWSYPEPSWKQSLFLIDFGIDFWSVLAPFPTPTWVPKSTKIDQKSMLRCILSGTPFWDPSWAQFWGQLDPPPTPKYWFLYWFFQVFLNIDHFKLTSILEPILEPTWLHFRPQNPPKTAPSWIPKAIQKLTPFRIVFQHFFARFWLPRWAHVGAMLGPKSPPEPALIWPCADQTPSW